ncbi:hypothetical protein SLEP1_g51835 [Rubroshorea leprosula]|uniref:Uncharacterized protein n=1 Tax=Rubroshorea leprosula TaxID=152421 RepID=A0AAV5M5H0_9ROSI|nr:hypothetical protein SLEP1_g51835 [Rubroshorea leprosula]
MSLVLFSLLFPVALARIIPVLDVELSYKGKSDNDAELAHDPWRNFDSVSWKDILDSCTESIEDQSLFSPSCPDIMGKFFSNSIVERLDFGVHSQIQKEYEASVEDSSSLSKQPMDQKLYSDSACDTTSKFYKEEVNHLELMNSIYPQLKRPDIRNDDLMENCFQTLLSNDEYDYALQPNPDGCFNLEGKSIHSSDTELLFDGISTEEGSKKMSSSGANGETGGNENEIDVSSIPSEGILDIQDINDAENYSDRAEANLLLRFDKILCSGSSATNLVTSSLKDASQLSSEISSLQKGDNKELDQMLKTGSGTEFFSEKFTDQLLQKHLKEKLRVWILQKDAEGGDGPSMLDEGGQGVLHLEAALGYDWALEPSIVAGVSVDFRDVNGWTALHWAAFCGREHTVASLISLGAATRALTHPSPKYASGRTPTDLASVNGHKGIAAYLADRSLDVHIPAINWDHQDDAAGPKAVPKISEISAAPLCLRNASDCQSRKDLSAISCRSLERGWKFLKHLKTISTLEGPILPTPSAMEILLIGQGAVEAAAITTVGAGAGAGAVAAAAAERVAGARAGTLVGAVAAGSLAAAETAAVAATIAVIVAGTAAVIAQLQLKLQLLGRGERRGQGARGQGADDEGPEWPEMDKGLKKDEGPEKEKEKGKKRAPHPVLESGKAYKILKAHSAYLVLLTARYSFQSMETIQMLVLVCVVTFLMLMVDLICQPFVSGEGNTGRIKCVFPYMLVLPLLICLSRSDVDVGVRRLALGEFIGMNLGFSWT